MTSELLILTFALVLFVYWFRYNCNTILRSPVSPDRAKQVAEANHLSFIEAQSHLQDASNSSDFDGVHASLSRDYEVLTCLIRYSSGSYTIEQRMLMVDFRIMHAIYSVFHFLPSQARRSLRERCHILLHFADSMRGRSGAMSRVSP